MIEDSLCYSISEGVYKWKNEGIVYNQTSNEFIFFNNREFIYQKIRNLTGIHWRTITKYLMAYCHNRVIYVCNTKTLKRE